MICAPTQIFVTILKSLISKTVVSSAKRSLSEKRGGEMSQTVNAETSSSGKNDLTEGVILFLRENDKKRLLQEGVPLIKRFMPSFSFD